MKVAHRPPLLIWLALVAGSSTCDSPPSAPRMTTQPLAARSGTVAEALNAHRAFKDWLTHFLSSPRAERERLISEGGRLARLRRPLLAQVLMSEPELGLTMALAPEERDSLPAHIARDVERWRDGRGMLHVIEPIVDDSEGETHPVNRFVTFRGEAELYRASVFGRRAGQPTLENLRLHGVELDGVIALTPSPLRQLSPGQGLGDLPVRHPSAGPDSSKCSEPELLFHGGDELFGFCSQLQATSFLASLTAEEELLLASPWAEGPKTVLFIRLDFADRPGDPLSQAAAEDLINVQVNQFYVQNSFNKTSMTATVTPTLRLPRTQADYAAAQDYIALKADAYAVAEGAGFSTSLPHFVIVAFAPTFSGWSGQAYVGSKGAWLNGDFRMRVAAHELGHNYGVRHANFWSAGRSISGAGTNVEYGNPFDVMGRGQGSHFNAWFKNVFDWVPASEVLTVATSGTYRVFALEQPVTTGAHGLKVSRDAQKDYWIEFRQALTGNPWLMSGASVNFGYTFNAASHLLDMTPDDGDRLNSPLLIGRTHSDLLADIHITPVGKGRTTPESLDVVINLGAFPANRPPSLTVAATATSVAPNTQVIFTATASDPDGDPLAYAWDFDDGSFGTNSASQTKILAAPRLYNVRCAVTDMRGRTANASVDVTVGTPSRFVLQGLVSAGGQPLGGVRVNAGTRWTETDSDGTFSLTEIPAGTHTVTASKFDYTFTRSFAVPLTVGASMSGLNFTGIARSGYQVRGRATAGGLALGGALVSEGTRSATTNAMGDYVLSTVPNGRSSLAATAPGWQLSPSGFVNPLEVYGGDVDGANFVATGQTLTGTLPGSVATAPTVTDGVRTVVATRCQINWCFQLALVPNGSWNLVALSPGVTFAPSNFVNPVAVAGAGRGSLNFRVTTGSTSLVSGTIRTGPTPLPGVAVSDGTRLATTDSLGRYTLVGVPPGVYTLTPVRSPYLFTPASLSVNVTTGNLQGNDFNTTVVNAPPTVAMPASASPASTTSTSQLSVLGADDSGESALSYSWAATGLRPVTFSANGTNAAKSSRATFSGAGTYTIEVIITDAGGLSARSATQVVVTQVATSLAVSPAVANLPPGATQFFAAQLRDQFANLMFAGSPLWSASGGGAIGSNGQFVAGSMPGGPHAITAAVAGLSASATVRVVGTGVPTIVTAAACSPATISGSTCQLGVRAADDDGEPNLTYTWSSAVGPAPVTFSINGTNAAQTTIATFAAAGSYQLVVTVQDPASNTIASSATVQVGATPTSLELAPTMVTLAVGEQQQFAASVMDQFGTPMLPEPTITWATTGGGTVDGAGLFTAGASVGGPFTVSATTGAIAATALLTVTAIPDTSPPTVSITSPLPNARLTGGERIVVQASDDVAVASVEVFSDALSLGRRSAPPWEFNVATTTLGAGPHTLTAQARDGAGNVATSAGVPVTVGAAPDTSPPTVQIVSPMSGADTGLWVEVAVETNDEIGVIRLELEVDGAVSATLVAPPWLWALELSEGNHTLVAIAHDAAGNFARSASVAISSRGTEEAPLPSVPPATGSCGCTGSGDAPLALALLCSALALGGRRRPSASSHNLRMGRSAGDGALALQPACFTARPGVAGPRPALATGVRQPRPVSSARP